jgi:hypothetical protein
MANYHSSKLGDLPYVDESEEIIVLPGIRFPDHYKVQEWIDGTDKSAELTLVITHIDDGKYMRTVAALQPANEKVLFIWKLRGVKELEEEILDFYSKKTYNI